MCSLGLNAKAPLTGDALSEPASSDASVFLLLGSSKPCTTLSVRTKQLVLYLEFHSNAKR
jgi:hypothetical protein